MHFYTLQSRYKIYLLKRILSFAERNSCETSVGSWKMVQTMVEVGMRMMTYKNFHKSCNLPFLKPVNRYSLKNTHILLKSSDAYIGIQNGK